MLSTGLPPLVGTSPVTSTLALRMGVRYECPHLPARLAQLATLIANDKKVVAAGCNRLLNVSAKRACFVVVEGTCAL